MTNKQFNKLLNRRISLIKKTLSKKAGEYASNNDRLHNFSAASKITKESKAKALHGMMLKHIVSVMDLIKYKDAGVKMDNKRIDEKIGDNINFLILLEAVLKEK